MELAYRQVSDQAAFALLKSRLLYGLKAGNGISPNSWRRPPTDGPAERVRYFIALDMALLEPAEQLVACQCINQVSWAESELCHLRVREEHRRQGIARFMLRQAMAHIQTPIAMCTIMADNEASIELHRQEGFSETCRLTYDGKWVVRMEKLLHAQWFSR